MIQALDPAELAEFLAEVKRNADALTAAIPMFPFIRKVAADARSDAEWLERNFWKLGGRRLRSGLGWPG